MTQKHLYLISLAAAILVAVFAGFVTPRKTQPLTATRVAPAQSTTAAPVAEPVTKAPAKAAAQPDVNEDLLLLINDRNPVPDTYVPELADTEFHQKIDKRAVAQLEKMLADARKAGCEPLPCSGYRTNEKQEEYYSEKLKSCRRAGLSKEEAEKEAARWVARPGTSEHQTGLAMDIIDLRHQELDEEQGNTKTQQWLMKHCTEYGFILRYPEDKKDITHIEYEPWHYRFVGVENAKKIAASGLCLEEYVENRNLSH